jgi:hypothetical protein
VGDGLGGRLAARGLDGLVERAAVARSTNPVVGRSLAVWSASTAATVSGP